MKLLLGLEVDEWIIVFIIAGVHFEEKKQLYFGLISEVGKYPSKYYV
jgi:hypothetical protein